MKRTTRAASWPNMPISSAIFSPRLDAVRMVADMDVPGFKLHPLKGREKGFWAVTVRANWRVIFRFADQDAFDVDYVDYH
jgi:proteic killer suppression protein